MFKIPQEQTQSEPVAYLLSFALLFCTASQLPFQITINVLKFQTLEIAEFCLNAAEYVILNNYLNCIN